MGHNGQSRTPGQGQDTARYLPYTPIFLKLPKLSPSRMGQRGRAQTLGQGQDIGRHIAESNVTAIIEVVGENAF